MNTVDTVHGLSGQTIVDLTKRHTLFEWSAQGAVDPIPVAGAKGCWFWTPEGKRYLDFNSQLMCVNIGHGDERVIKAIQEQAATLVYANPFMATEPRAKLGEKLASIAPGDIDVFFFTNGGAEENENGIQRGWDPVDLALANLEEIIQLEGPQTIAAFFLETVTGTNGVLVPPDGYLEGVRELCTKYGILMVADEV